MDSQDWERAKGVSCSRCGCEAFRCKDGMCLLCWEEVNEIELRVPNGIENRELSEWQEIAKTRKRERG